MLNNPLISLVSLPILCSTYAILSSPVISEWWLINLILTYLLQIDNDNFFTNDPLGHLYFPIQGAFNDVCNLGTLDNFHPFIFHSLHHETLLSYFKSAFFLNLGQTCDAIINQVYFLILTETVKSCLQDAGLSKNTPKEHSARGLRECWQEGLILKHWKRYFIIFCDQAWCLRVERRYFWD